MEPPAPDATAAGDGFAAFGARARRDLPFALLAILFAVVPLFRSAALEDSFNTPKTGWMLLLGTLALLALLPRIRRGCAPRPGPVDFLVGGLWLIHAASAAWAASGALAAWAMAQWTALLVLVAACRAVIRGPRDAAPLLACGFAAAVATAAWTVGEDCLRGTGFDGVVARLPDWRGYLSAGLGNSGHIAGYVGMFLPAGLLFVMATRSRAAALAAGTGIAVIFAAQVVTWSVGSTGGTLIALAAWGAFAAAVPAIRGALRWRRLAVLAAVGVAISAFYLLPHPLNPHPPSLWREAFGSQRWEEGWPTRVAIWKTTAHIIGGHPLAGIGAGNFTYEYVRQVVPGVIGDPALAAYAGSFTNDAHNEYLHLWSEAGIAAPLLFLALVGMSVAAAVRRCRAGSNASEILPVLAAGAGITVFALDALMTFPLRLPSHLGALALFLAVAAAPPAGAPAPHRRRGAFATLLLAALLGAAAFAWQARRITAEYLYKTGRTIAETAVVVEGGRPMPAWAAADAAFGAATRALSAGDREAAARLRATALRLASAPGIAEGRAWFDRALRVDPRYANASSRLGAMLLMRGDFRGAIAALTQAQRDLQASETFERLAMAHYLLGENDAAVAALKVVLERRPPMARLVSGLIQQVAR